VRAVRPACARTTHLQHRSGQQFTSEEFTSALLKEGIKISVDGKGRATDNAFIERLWRNVKQQCLYLRSPRTATNCVRSWSSTSPSTTTNALTSNLMASHQHICILVFPTPGKGGSSQPYNISDQH